MSLLGISLVFPLGSCPCGCAGGTLLGTAGGGGGACSLTTRTNCTLTLADMELDVPGSWRSSCLSLLDLSSTCPSLLAVTWVSALPVEHMDSWFFWEMTF